MTLLQFCSIMNFQHIKQLTLIFIDDFEQVFASWD